MANIIGTPGNDSLAGGNNNDLVDGLAGNDTLDGGAGDDTMRGAAGNDTMIWNPGGANDLMEGGAGIDTAVVNGGLGAEIFTIAADGTGVRFDRLSPAPFGIDIRTTEKLEINAGGGEDLVAAIGNLAGRIALKISGDAGNDTITGGNGNDELLGGADEDVLNGGAGSDTLDGGLGNDKMAGGTGNDLYVIDSEQDAVTEKANEGTDRVRSLIDHTLGANIENLTLAGTAIEGFGNELANVIEGNDKDNELGGLDGNDTIFGGDGNDLIFGDDGNDNLNGGAGDDALIGGAENDILNGNNGDDFLVGDVGDDTLTGGDGNDTLDGEGGEGDDRMIGGKGDDAYFVGSTKDVVIEIANQGKDTVNSVISHTLSANVENLNLVSAGDINGTGNTLGNVITGNNGKNRLDGGAGNDTLDGGGGNDTMLGGAGNDTMIWNPGGADDVMDGGAGIDTAVVNGATGSEAFVITADGKGGVRVDRTDPAPFFVDIRATERLALNAGGGDDTVTAGGGLDKLIALSIDGGAGNDTISSGGSNDSLVGGLGNDALEGGGGNDTLDGGDGNDSLRGGRGNDLYILTDNLDGVREFENEGIDTVRTFVSDIVLDTNVENLVMGGTDDLDGSGNELANVLTGNNGNNALNGGAGNDTLTGGDGNDTLDGEGGEGDDRMIGGKGDDAYFVDSTKDVVIEIANQGKDTVNSVISHTLSANVENLNLLFSAGDINGTGNTLGNVITGNNGKNRLDGGAGNDTLDGGAGNDTMIWSPGGADDVMDGGAGVDTAVVNGGGAAEVFTLAADGKGVRFDRSNPLPFGIDIRGTERLVVNAGAGNDSFAASGNLAALIALTINGDGGNDTIAGGNGNDVLNGGADDDTLTGGNGNDTLDGGDGIDKMEGGKGNDIYFVDDDVDDVFEIAGEGFDSVESSVSYALRANVESLTLAGAADIEGFGNDLANVINGNNGSNLLDGLEGNDTLNGNGGNDELLGFDGNDILNGGAGNDELDGETGNDTLNGGDGNDEIIGGTGDDRMVGGKGDDEYEVDSTKDVVIESANQGVDIVFSRVTFSLGANLEHLVLFGDEDINGNGNVLGNEIQGNDGRNRIDGGSGNDDLSGGAGNDTLIGGAGSDVLEGGEGADLMDGGAGSDFFRYLIDDPTDLATLGGDVINGFQHGQDRIDLSDLFTEFGINPDDAFSGGFLKIDVVGNNTNILFDADGGGDGFITLATLNNVKNVTAEDLITVPL